MLDPDATINVDGVDVDRAMAIAHGLSKSAQRSESDNALVVLSRYIWDLRASLNRETNARKICATEITRLLQRIKDLS